MKKIPIKVNDQESHQNSRERNLTGEHPQTLGQTSFGTISIKQTQMDLSIVKPRNSFDNVQILPEDQSEIGKQKSQSQKISLNHSKTSVNLTKVTSYSNLKPQESTITPQQERVVRQLEIPQVHQQFVVRDFQNVFKLPDLDKVGSITDRPRIPRSSNNSFSQKRLSKNIPRQSSRIIHAIPNKQSRQFYDKVEERTQKLQEMQLQASIKKRIEQRKEDSLKIQLRLERAKQVEHQQRTEAQTPNQEPHPNHMGQIKSQRLSKDLSQEEAFHLTFKEVKTGLQKQREIIQESKLKISSQRACSQVQTPNDMFDENLSLGTFMDQGQSQKQTFEQSLRRQNSARARKVKAQLVREEMERKKLQNNLNLNKPPDISFEIEERVKPMLKKKFNVFSATTQTIFLTGAEKVENKIVQSLRMDQNMYEKSQLYENYLKYFNERIKTRDQLENDVEGLIQEIYDDVEDKNIGCLAPLVKFVDSIFEIGSHASVKRDVAKYRKQAQNNFQAPQVQDPGSLRGSIERLKNMNINEPQITEEELNNKEEIEGKVDLTKMSFTSDPRYEHLFSQEGFLTDFMQRFNETQKAISVKVKQLSQLSNEPPKALSLKLSAITSHCLYYLKYCFSWRLRVLFNILDNKKTIDHDLLLEKKEKEFQLEIQRLKQKNTQLQQQMDSNNESFYSMNTALFEANRDKDDLKTQINELIKSIGNLKEHNLYLENELKDTKDLLKRQAKKFLNEINDNSSSDDDIKASCRTDYEQDTDSRGKMQIPRGDEAISNITMSLAAMLRQIQSQRHASLDVKDKFEKLVEVAVSQTQRKVDAEQQQIFQKLMAAADKGKQKYIIRQEFEMVRDKMQIYVCQSTQTDAVKIESPKSQTVVEMAMFDKSSQGSEDKKDDKPAQQEVPPQIFSRRTSLDIALKQLKVYGMKLMQQSAESEDGMVIQINNQDLQKMLQEVEAQEVEAQEEPDKIEQDQDESEKEEASDHQQDKNVAQKSDLIRQKMQQFLMREDKPNHKSKFNPLLEKPFKANKLEQISNQGIIEPQIGQMTKEKQSIIDQLRAQQGREANNIKVLSKDKLFNVIDELLARRLHSLLQQQQAFRGYQDPNKSVQDEKQAYTKIGKDESRVEQAAVVESMLEFTFQHYLGSFGLRSGVIKQLLSLAAGLRKYHQGNNEKNYFAKYLYYLFNFDVSEPLTDKDNKAIDIKVDDQSSLYTESNIISISFDPFKGFYDSNTEQLDIKAKQRFSEEQVCIVVWSRHVFLYAEQAFLQQSIDKVAEARNDPNINQANVVTVSQLELTQRRQKLAYYLRNGGQLHLSFLLQILRQAFLGDEYQETNKIMPKKFAEMQNQFLELVSHIQLEDLTIFDVKNPDMAQQHKKIYDFNKNYQLLAEAKFILFKFFIIIKYAHIDIDQLAFLPKQSDPQPQSNQQSPAKPLESQQSIIWGGKKINISDQQDEDQKLLDLNLLLMIINQRIITDKQDDKPKQFLQSQTNKKKLLLKQNEKDKSMQKQVFSKTQVGVLINYLAKFGFIDIRKMPLEDFKELMEQIVSQKQYLEEIVSDENDFDGGGGQKGEDDLFLISFTQFSKVCLDQWRRNLQRQVLQLKKIFIEADLDGDGVLTFEEFWLILKQMEERQKLAMRMMEERRFTVKAVQRDPSVNDLTLVSQNNSTAIREDERIRQENRVKEKKLEKNEALALFNEALEMSIQEKGEEAEGQDLDQITPLAFTKMILKNQIGGFGSGTVFSDLRYTLQDSKFPGKVDNIKK